MQSSGITKNLFALSIAPALALLMVFLARLDTVFSSKYLSPASRAVSPVMTSLWPGHTTCYYSHYYYYCLFFYHYDTQPPPRLPGSGPAASTHSPPSAPSCCPGTSLRRHSVVTHVMDIIYLSYLWDHDPFGRECRPSQESHYPCHGQRWSRGSGLGQGLQTSYHIEDSATLTRNVKDLQVPVPQPEHVTLSETRDTGWGLYTVVTCPPVTRLGRHLLARDPAGRHELVALSDHLGLGCVGPDPGELVGSAAVVKVTVGQDNLERLLWGPEVTRGWPQTRPAQVAREAVDADTRVYQEITLTPLQ